MSSPRNRRCARNFEVVDNISNLPDAILCHILSFVPSKSAVKTSILSKRWKFLWTEVPALDFSEMPPPAFSYSVLTWQQKICFKNFVDRVILHNNVPFLWYLNFRIWQEDDDVYIKSWINAIRKREAHEIDIGLFHRHRGVPVKEVPVLLPKKFFYKERLVVLKLDGNFTISVPMSLHLPKLEIAHFIHLELPNDEFIMRLSLGSPVLKELCILYCEGITSTLYVESLTLNRLEIRSTMDKSRTQQANIVIKAPNLGYLYLEDILKEHVIGELSWLVEADLDLYYDNVNYALELVRKVSGVKTLRLAHQCLEFVSNPPIFQNLTCLKLENDENMYMVLECAPKLKSLTFERVLCFDNLYESKPVPTCLSCLETVEFNWVDPLGKEMTLIEYFLRGATALKEMKIFLSSMETECERDVCLKLLMLPRTSSACRVEVHLEKE